MSKKYCILNEKEHEAKYCVKKGVVTPFEAGIPLLDISDADIQEIYYFRWNTFFRHIKPTPIGYVITEFWELVSWAGSYGAISCASGHHFYEGRWIHDNFYMDQYAKLWYSRHAKPRQYSCWLVNGILSYCDVTGDYEIAKKLYNKMKTNFAKWHTSHLLGKGLYYQIDDRDGMELSIGGSGYRTTINSYMYSEARGLARIAKMLGLYFEAKHYNDIADELKRKINTMLWDKDAEFFKTLTVQNNFNFVDVREEIGFIPWYFNIPDDDKSVAWKFLNDEKHFNAPYGPTTAEMCHERFMFEHTHECLWNGPVWPYATSQTLTALGNLLCNYNQDYMTRSDYFAWVKKYAMSQHITIDGVTKPHIDEDQHPHTGDWIARTILQDRPESWQHNRGEDYNHSTFCDLVLNGIVGIRPQADKTLVIDPLFEEKDLEYLCADGILYHGKYVCVCWDRNGERYGKGKGLRVLVNGIEAARADTLQKLELKI